jgi:hypothetical protein
LPSPEGAARPDEHSGLGITATATDGPDNLDYFASAGFRVCRGTLCLGWRYFEGGRVSSDIARIRIQPTWGGQAHDLTVTDGWYALSWISGDPQAGWTPPSRRTTRTAGCSRP